MQGRVKAEEHSLRNIRRLFRTGSNSVNGRTNTFAIGKRDLVECLLIAIRGSLNQFLRHEHAVPLQNYCKPDTQSSEIRQITLTPRHYRRVAGGATPPPRNRKEMWGFIQHGFFSPRL